MFSVVRERKEEVENQREDFLVRERELRKRRGDEKKKFIYYAWKTCQILFYSGLRTSHNLNSPTFLKILCHMSFNISF